MFDYQNRMEKLSRKPQPLERLNGRIDWEMFRSVLGEVTDKTAKGAGGRPRYDSVMMFKILILQRYYNLSDEQTEFQIEDRLTFQKFLGLTLSDSVPDEKTIWIFREELTKAGIAGKLFKRFEKHLEEVGLTGKEGKIIDASFVDVPRQRNNREENEQIKSGEIPDSFKENANRLRQKDTDARWAKKGDEVHYGYKNHVKVDKETKLIDEYKVTEASVHDSQVMRDLVEKRDGTIHADSAYAGEEIEATLRKKGVKSRICEKGCRNHSLSEKQKETNRRKSKIRARVEHVFGFMTNTMRNGLYMRWVGKKRTTAGIGLLNLVYNIARYEQILRLKLA